LLHNSGTRPCYPYPPSLKLRRGAGEGFESRRCVDIYSRSGVNNLSRKLIVLAEPTGLEPATFRVTGERSNQLNYGSAIIS